MAIAFAIALAVHESIAGFIPRPASEKGEAPVRSQVMTIVLRTPAPTPEPTPQPTAQPTPQPVTTFSEFATRAQAAPVAAAPVRNRLGGRAANRSVVVVPPHSNFATPQAVALATANAAGLQNGGSGTGAGPGINGNGGLNGNGAGLGGAGNGSGGGVKPCGVVLIVPIPGMIVFNRDGSRTIGVELQITLSDGQTVSDTLGWKFHYKGEADDPFSKRGQEALGFAPLQLPPPGYDLEGRQKPATVYAIKHTNAQGTTDLEDCPDQK
jgi:hypothetical protein